jgi:hypothetical protein
MNWMNRRPPGILRTQMARRADDERLEDLAEDRFYEQQQRDDTAADRAEDAWLRTRGY